MYLSMRVRQRNDHALFNVEGDVDINSAPWSKLVERLAELTGLPGKLPVAGPIAAGPPVLGA
jgi:hypothetical protein